MDRQLIFGYFGHCFLFLFCFVRFSLICFLFYPFTSLNSHFGYRVTPGSFLFYLFRAAIAYFFSASAIPLPLIFSSPSLFLFSFFFSLLILFLFLLLHSPPPRYFPQLVASQQHFRYRSCHRQNFMTSVLVSVNSTKYFTQEFTFKQPKVYSHIHIGDGLMGDGQSEMFLYPYPYIQSQFQVQTISLLVCTRISVCTRGCLRVRTRACKCVEFQVLSNIRDHAIKQFPHIIKI